ncbi:hypothetical protein D3C76_1803730 [compost metagenome]
MQVDQVVEHLPTDIRHAALANPRHQVKAGEGADRQTHYQQQEQADALVEQVR